jgi:membrane-associated protease RseP (regulator of RpoE activity)
VWLESVTLAAHKTWNLSALTLKFLGKLIMGEASIKGISGPVSIGEMAGKSAMMGLETYIQFLGCNQHQSGCDEFIAYPSVGWRTFVVLHH